jgi:two-component system, LytTR family, response regulator
VIKKYPAMSQGHLIKTIVIDDEMSAILLLEEMMNKLEGIAAVGHAQDIEEGLNLILHHRPDIVFLDIKLNEEIGFDVIHRLKDYDVDPIFVMVTGYDQFGLEAIKAGAFDYLLKPVSPDELLRVVSRYRQKHSKLPQPETIQKIRFNTLGGFILINPDEILYCKADANYTDIFLINQQKHTISLNIGTIEKMLIRPVFFRISRSIIINIKFLTEINRGKRLCTLSAGHNSCSLSISRERIKDLEGALVH